MNKDITSFTPKLPGEIFDGLPKAVRFYISSLETVIQQQQHQIQQQQHQIQQQQHQIQQQQHQIQQQKLQIERLETKVHELEIRLSKDSSNSNKPPSSDGLKRKTKSLRESSSKQPGGQEGHKGKGLLQVENPDLVIIHTPIDCKNCGFSLNEVLGTCIEKRQVFDTPQPKMQITEHRVEKKSCPCCGVVTKMSFPENVKGPVQYGDRVRALIAYFSHQHFMPVDRICETLNDIFGISLSPGTCAKVDENLFTNLASFEASLKAYLLANQTLHFDETGMRCEKKLYWVHVASSQMATLYTIHAKRGQEAMKIADILPRFEGTAVHDHWFPYFSFQNLTHGLCNAHHLRELAFIYEQEKEEWAKKGADLLIRAKKEVEKHTERLPVEIWLEIEESYQKIISEGLAYHASLPALSRNKRGKQKQRDGKNLLDRLNEKRDCVLRFARDFSVPFTNNQGEQDIRMVKLKQKIAGCFRTSRGGQIFCRVRSYLSTARKQSWNIWDALANAIQGNPYLFTLSISSSSNNSIQFLT